MEQATHEPTTVLVFACRKQGLTFDEFKTYYETKHVPLVISLLAASAPHAVPLSYTRHYIDRGTGAGAAPSFPLGGVEEWKYDSLARSTFRDVEHRNTFFAEFAKIGEPVGADEDKFMERSQMKIVFVSEGATNKST